MQWGEGETGAFESHSYRGPPRLSRRPAGFSHGVCFVDVDAICQVPGRLSPWGVEVKLIVFNFV